MKVKGWMNGGRVSRSKMNKCKSSRVGHGLFEKQQGGQFG